MSPFRLTFEYSDKIECKVKVMYSRTNRKPEEKHCDRMFEDPTSIEIKALNERLFDDEVFFFKLQTTTGCMARIKVSYPNQDWKEKRKV